MREVFIHDSRFLIIIGGIMKKKKAKKKKRTKNTAFKPDKKKNLKKKGLRKSKITKPNIKNYMENIVGKNMAMQLAKRKDLCRCERCRLDIMAFALNHLPPKYVVTKKGGIYTRLAEMEFQLNADVTREVYKAIEVVRKNKRHKEV